MNEFHLKFNDQAAAAAMLFNSIIEQDATRLVPRYDAIDVIGIIRRPTGTMIDSPEGPVPEMAAIEGWHVNVRHRSPVPELEPFAVNVTNPVRRWA